MRLSQYVTIGATLTAVCFFMNQSAFAETTPSTAVSKNSVEFQGGNTDPTDPVDPTDPDNPNPPIDPVDPSNPGTGNPGPLSIDFISNIQFGSQDISTKTETYHALNEHPYVQVTDKTGQGKGWDLVATASEFKDSSGSKTLKGAELTFLNGQTNTNAANVSAAPTAQQRVSFTNQSAQPIMTAQAGEGKGTWVDVWSGKANDNGNVTLKVLPGSADEATYTATIDWTLTIAP